MRTLRRLFTLTLAGLLALTPWTADAQGIESRQAILESAYLYNFSFFVDWPATAFKGPHDPLIVGVAGRNALINTISEAVKGKKVQSRSFEVVRINSPADAKQVHILFIGFQEPGKIQKYLSELGQLPVLTVSDNEQFNAMGGMIRFFPEDDRLRFEINLEAAKASKIGIQAKLLALARVNR